jgi:site-specific DNA-methyltransferase (adenine-specific)/site-specific DNA-methyltransferase (cytosine-N4-specific)
MKELTAAAALTVANVETLQYLNKIFCGDSVEVLRELPDGSVNLIVTSPPYADQRKATYGGVHPDKYVDWFLPIASELKRTLRDDGSFVLNIKEKERKKEMKKKMEDVSA